MSGQLEEPSSCLNAPILEVINCAIAEKVLPSIENAIRQTKSALNTKWDIRSDGPHQSESAQAFLKGDHRSDRPHPIETRPITQKCDAGSYRPHLSKVNQTVQEHQNDFPRLITTSSNQNDHCKEIQ